MNCQQCHAVGGTRQHRPLRLGAGAASSDDRQVADAIRADRRNAAFGERQLTQSDLDDVRLRAGDANAQPGSSIPSRSSGPCPRARSVSAIIVLMTFVFAIGVTIREGASNDVARMDAVCRPGRAGAVVAMLCGAGASSPRHRRSLHARASDARQFVYIQECLSCHGARLQGISGPPLQARTSAARWRSGA